MNWTEILVVAIPALATMITTIITTAGVKKDARLNSMRCQIIALMTDDKVDNDYENYQAIHNLFDEYRKLGGNSYIISKISEYDERVKRLKAKPSDEHGYI